MDSQLPDGATPLDPDEAEALIPSHITTVRALNEWEQANIVSARRWALNTRKDLLSVSGVRELHRRMFDETWRWAGKFRVSDKTIGVPKAMITEAVKNACDDARTWIEAPGSGMAVRVRPLPIDDKILAVRRILEP